MASSLEEAVATASLRPAEPRRGGKKTGKRLTRTYYRMVDVGGRVEAPNFTPTRTNERISKGGEQEGRMHIYGGVTRGEGERGGGDGNKTKQSNNYYVIGHGAKATKSGQKMAFC